MKYLFIAFLFVTNVVVAQSSMAISSPDTSANSIEKIVRSLEGEGVILMNISSNQKAFTNQLGKFNDKDMSLSMKKGMVMSTGSVHMINKPNELPGFTGNINPYDGGFDTITVESCSEEKKMKLQTGLTSIAIDIATPEMPYKVIETKNDSVYKVDTLFYPSTETIKPKTTTITKNCTPYTYFVPKNQGYYTQKGDEDLSDLLGKGTQIFDACSVEMDIIPLGDTLNFRYLFGSEEYDEYVCSAFNDAFAFYISGPDIDGKKNLAVLENGARVTINSINKGNPGNPNCVKSNPDFYNKNVGQIPLEYDGFTRTLEIVQPVKAFNTYHLKMVIADAGDGAYDSGVFIEAQSILSYNNKYVIPFASDSSMLSPKTKEILKAMMKVVKNHPEYTMEISGHTDNEGSDEYNIGLSARRNQTVMNYIEKAGYSRQNISVLAKGESMPIASNDDEEGRQKNRRVEIKLIPTYKAKTLENKEYQLSQNIPNPSREYTSIQAEFPENENATIRIMSINGVLMGDYEMVDGQAKINTSDFAAGIYQYLLIVNGEIKVVKKMVVVQ